MKPFNLEAALAGEPVVTRNGEKAFILNNLNNVKGKGFTPDYPLVGIIHNVSNIRCWTLDGRSSLQNDETPSDIVGMWTRPKQSVTVTLPCPLKQPEDEMWYFDLTTQKIIKSAFSSRMDKEDFDYSIYFGSKEDAHKWLNAMKNNRA